MRQLNLDRGILITDATVDSMPRNRFMEFKKKFTDEYGEALESQVLSAPPAPTRALIIEGSNASEVQSAQQTIGQYGQSAANSWVAKGSIGYWTLAGRAASSESVG